MVVRKTCGDAFAIQLAKLVLWIRDKFTEAGIAMAPVEHQPDYMALADLLKRAFNQLDRFLYGRYLRDNFY